jgi:hypothetical protein
MSIKSFLSRIWKQIKAVFEHIPADVKTAIHIGVQVTENIKLFIESPVADVLTTIIPGDVDDKIKALLRAKLPEIVLQLKLADSCMQSAPNEVMQCALATLQNMPGGYKKAFLHNLSIVVAQVAADGKLDWADAVYLSQWYYQQQFKR